jgi:16S rRNA (guanine527-N7)-methyltransferase
MENGVDVTDGQITLLRSFSNLLLEWNKKINLVSRKDEKNFWVSHLLHSVSILFKLRLPLGASVLDLGTGGGLPGIPLKIMLSDISMTLVDSTQKKIKVVEDILHSLSLPNTSAVWGRAEELGRHKDHHARYDVVVARAVAPLKDLVRWSKPLLKSTPRPGVERDEQSQGVMRVVPPALIALKGGDLETEIRSARRIPGVESIKVLDLTMTGSVQLEADDKKLVLVAYEQPASNSRRN